MKAIRRFLLQVLLMPLNISTMSFSLPGIPIEVDIGTLVYIDALHNEYDDIRSADSEFQLKFYKNALKKFKQCESGKLKSEPDLMPILYNNIAVCAYLAGEKSEVGRYIGLAYSQIGVLPLQSYKDAIERNFRLFALLKN